MTKEQEFMSEEAFNELIDNLEIVEKLTLCGTKNIKYYFKKLKEENENLKLILIDSTSRRTIEDLKKSKKANDDLKFLSDGYEIEIKKLKKENEKLQEELNKKDKEIEKYKYLYQKALDNTVSADRENTKLNEIIQKMVKYIKQEDVSEKFCDYKVVCDMHCEECILAYFKVDEEENK